MTEFPHLSETFILAQVLTALKLGYDVKILIVKLLDIENSLHKDVLIKNNILNTIIVENYNIPKNKILRVKRFLIIGLKNLKKIKAIISYYKRQNSFSLSWLFQWSFYEKFNSNQNIFHVQYGTNRSPLDLLKATGFYKPSLIVTFHGHDAFFPINGFIPNNGYYDNLFAYASLITANTPYLAEKILDLGCPKEKLKTIPVGVNTSFFKPIPEKVFSKEKLKIITVGRLDFGKGHKYGIEIIKHLVNHKIPVEFNIVGEGKEFQKLQNQIQTNDLQEHVFLLGKKNQKEIRDLLRQHDLYLLTAVAMEGGRRETQGLATIEAQACGLPAVVFDSGGVKYTVEDGVTGYVCEEYNVDEVVTKIKTLYDDVALLTEMSKNTQKFVQEHYSLFSVEKKWEIIYKNIFD